MILRTGIFLAVLLLFAGCASTEDSPPAEPGPIAGEVTAVAIDGNGDTELTVLREDGSLVYLVVPQRLARSLRIQQGDRVWSDEKSAVLAGERLSVQTLRIER